MSRLNLHPILRIAFLGLMVAAATLLARGPITDEGERSVIVTEIDMANLSAQFQRTWQRPPTASELRGSLEQFVRQEVLYREALFRGYDRDDPAVRLAMRQKMEYLALSQVTEAIPSDPEVEAYYALREERYRIAPEVSFAQVYLNPETTNSEQVEQLLDQLRREDPEPDGLGPYGDRTMLPSFFGLVSVEEIDRQLGAEFSEQVVEIEPGGWVGPLESGFGLHLVKVLDRRESRIPELSEVASRVVADMQYEAGQAAREQLYQEVAQSFRVVFDRPVQEFLESSAE